MRAILYIKKIFLFLFSLFSLFIYSARFRNLHNDCLEEEELPVITAGDDTITLELENFQDKPKELEAQEKQRKDKVSEENVATDKEKLTSETETKKLPPRDVKQTEVNPNTGNSKSTKSNAVLNLKTKQLPKTINIKALNDEKQNTPDCGVLRKAKPNISVPKALGSSSVLSFSDWLKNKKEQSAKLDDNLEKSSVQSTTVKEMFIEKTKANFKIRMKSLPKAVDPADPDKQKEDIEKQSESAIENKQTQEAIDDKAKNQDTMESLNNSLVQPSDTQMEISVERTKTDEKSNKSNKKGKSKRKSKYNQQRAGQSSTTSSPTVSKTSQLDLQDDNSCDSKLKMDSPHIPTPTLVRAKKKRNEIDVLIESMSKEMKDGGINDLLSAETHVKRQRLATKRIFTGSSEHLNTSSNTTTTKDAPGTPTTTTTTTAGTVSSKEIPKVIEFGESLDLLSSSPKELNKSPNKRRLQQIATKSPKSSGHKNTADVADSTSDVKSRKSLNPKDLTSHNSNREALSPTIAMKLRKSMPQAKETNVEKISLEREEKTRKSMPSTKEQEKGSNRNMSSIFKAPKPVVFNVTPDHESLLKPQAEDNKRSQSRNNKVNIFIKF